MDIGKNFEIDGYELEYPGDPKAPGYLIYNCRCTTITIDKFHDKNAPRASKLGEVSYEEWKAGKEVNLKNKCGTYSENSQNSIEKHTNSGKIDIGIQFYANKEIAKRSDRQLEKSISSWETNIDRHLEKIRSPEIYDAGWSSKDERQKTGLINHWKKEIRILENNINDAEAELKKGGTAKMSDSEKIIEYELQIEDMLHTLQSRMDEFTSEKNLDDFEKGRQLAYQEIMEIIQTRHKMIMDVLEE